MRHHRYKSQPLRPLVGSVFSDSIGREWACVQPGQCSITVRLLVDGKVTESNVTLGLDTLKPVNKKVNITIEDVR